MKEGRGEGKEGGGRLDSLHVLWEEGCASKAVSKVSLPAFRVLLIESQVDPSNHSTH